MENMESWTLGSFVENVLRSSPLESCVLEKEAKWLDWPSRLSLVVAYHFRRLLEYACFHRVRSSLVIKFRNDDYYFLNEK
jgi:hypothetical protein